MGIFDNYQNLDNTYVPNNLSQSFPKKIPCCKPQFKKPFEDYNAEGKLIGYYWYYGNTVSLHFNITGEIIVEDTDIIYTAIGQGPTVNTTGPIGCKAYNVIDLLSWTLVSIHDNSYIWEQDSQFICPNNGQRNVYFTAEQFLKNRYVKITILNFRKEPIYQETFAGDQSIVLNIDENLSAKLIKGVYYYNLEIFGQDGTCITPNGINGLTLTVR